MITTIRTVAVAIATFIFLAMAAGLISANVRQLAADRDWDQYLLRAWNALPVGIHNLLAGVSHHLAGWQLLRQLWWLWLVLGLTGGLGAALTIFDSAEPSAILKLDDGKRWRFVKYFQDQTLPPNNRALISCDAAVSIKLDSKVCGRAMV